MNEKIEEKDIEVKLNKLKNWIENKNFMNFLAKKGVEVSFTRDYSFNRRPKDTRIAGDFMIVNSHYENFVKQILK